MFMQERSTRNGTNGIDNGTDNDTKDLIKNSSESRDSLYENHDDNDRLCGGTKCGTCGTNGTNYGTDCTNYGTSGTTNGTDSTNNVDRFYKDEHAEDTCGTTNYSTRNGTRNSDGTNGTENGTNNGTKFYMMDHEESPDSNDSAYDSGYRKKRPNFSRKPPQFLPTDINFEK